jgi:hypothetical protein
MSIEFSPAFDSARSSLRSRGMGASPMQPAAPMALRRSKKRLKPRTRGRDAHSTSASPRRVAANRRNAQRSTGPRTAAGKKRASRNAIKHGLCSRQTCLDGECPAAYATFVRELEEELQPRTTLQRALLPHIANLLWRIDRLPQAQVDMFELELHKCAKGEAISAAQVLARRFSDEPTSNGFLLISRYERGLHNQLHRLMTRYEWLKKNRARMPIDEDEALAARRRRNDEVDASIAADARRIRAEYEAEEARKAARAEAARAEGALAEPANPQPGKPQAAQSQSAQALPQPAESEPPKRTQSNPPLNLAAASPSRKSAEIVAAPVTKRTHRELAAPAAASGPTDRASASRPGM